jgi:glycerol uptake facilitator-like aquaporin
VSRILAEGVGTAALTTAIAGSNLMAIDLGADPAVALLIVALGTATVLAAAIAALQPVSGAHFNPAVSVSEWFAGRLDGRELVAYLVVQLAGGVGGVILANGMFGAALLEASGIDRSGPAMVVSEAVATAGLVGIIAVLVGLGRSAMVAAGVGIYVFGIHFMTASTGFANPAVSVARIWAHDPAGIAPESAAAFVAIQLVTGLGVGLVVRRMS